MCAMPWQWRVSCSRNSLGIVRALLTIITVDYTNIQVVGQSRVIMDCRHGCQACEHVGSPGEHKTAGDA